MKRPEPGVGFPSSALSENKKKKIGAPEKVEE
jgi:hypothetical protein